MSEPIDTTELTRKLEDVTRQRDVLANVLGYVGYWAEQGECWGPDELAVLARVARLHLGDLTKYSGLPK